MQKLTKHLQLEQYIIKLHHLKTTTPKWNKIKRNSIKWNSLKTKSTLQHNRLSYIQNGQNGEKKGKNCHTD